MKRIAIWVSVVFVAGCGGEAPKPSLEPGPAKSQPQPEPPKPRDEAKEATDSFPGFAREKVADLAKVFVGNTVTMRLKDGARFEYKITELKVRDTDVRKTDSLSSPIVGTIRVDVILKLESVTGFPKQFVPASAEEVVRKVDVECLRQGTAWVLKSSEDVSVAILTPPK